MKTDEERFAEGWKIERCFSCGGFGVVSDYGWGGDFEGPKECNTCQGNGSVWITPKGKAVLYPGGPFV